MERFLLRVEGVNLANVYDDTDDLSTRRGGGLMVLNAVAQMIETLADRGVQERLTPVATGASVGLFEFEAKDQEDAETVRQAIVSHFLKERMQPLGQGKQEEVWLNRGTFVVDVVPVRDSEMMAERRAKAANRWRQLQEPAVALADAFTGGATSFCHFDRIRPATRMVPMPEGAPAKASTATAERRAYGRAARQRFYQEEVEAEADLKFTDDIRTLATTDARSAEGQDRPKLCPLRAPSHLHDKVAVFHVDGNKFGQKGDQQLERGTAAYRTWSSALKSHHRGLLKGLLELCKSDPSWKHGDLIRLETLLWGGDEILWVVPAWKGWELAEWFFSQEHSVTIDGKPVPLTYAAGLVFCHAKAPIRDIIDLAENLVRLSKGPNQSEEHRLAYEVLESFDDIDGDLDDLLAHRRQWLPADESAASLVIDPRQPSEFWSALRTIAGSAEFPMRQLYMLCREWRRGGDWTGEMTKHRNRLEESGVAKELSAIARLFPENPVAYLHLMQMLPYMPTSTRTE